jgi:hypothetical protein
LPIGVKICLNHICKVFSISFSLEVYFNFINIDRKM